MLKKKQCVISGTLSNFVWVFCIVFFLSCLISCGDTAGSGSACVHVGQAGTVPSALLSHPVGGVLLQTEVVQNLDTKAAVNETDDSLCLALVCRQCVAQSPFGTCSVRAVFQCCLCVLASSRAQLPPCHSYQKKL